MRKQGELAIFDAGTKTRSRWKDFRDLRAKQRILSMKRRIFGQELEDKLDI